MTEALPEKEAAVIVEGMTVKSLGFSDDIDLMTNDEEEASENANTLLK